MLYTCQDKILQNMMSEYIELNEKICEYYAMKLDKKDPDDFAKVLNMIQLSTLLGQNMYRRTETVGFINDLDEED